MNHGRGVGYLCLNVAKEAPYVCPHRALHPLPILSPTPLSALSHSVYCGTVALVYAGAAHSGAERPLSYNNHLQASYCFGS